MNDKFAKFININGKYRFFNNDSDLIKIYQEEINQLTNNWNELEEWLKDFKRLYEGNEFQNNAKFCITVDQALDKMKEIKEGNNVSSRD